MRASGRVRWVCFRVSWAPAPTSTARQGYDAATPFSWAASLEAVLLEDCVAAEVVTAAADAAVVWQKSI